MFQKQKTLPPYEHSNIHSIWDGTRFGHLNKRLNAKCALCSTCYAKNSPGEYVPNMFHLFHLHVRQFAADPTILSDGAG